MKLSFFRTLLILVVITGIGSCKKDPEPVVPSQETTGSVTLHFQNRVGDSVLVLDTKYYVNANDDTFNISRFDYYISNIKLIKEDLTVFAESESYHLLKANTPGSLDIVLSNVPLGTYTGLQFMIGVDSTRNVSGAQTGALDPSNGMFWTWSSGYIMAKMEGTTNSGNDLEFHIGGFKGINSVLKTVTPSFNSAIATVSASGSPQIYLNADVAEWFTTPVNIDFSNTHSISTSGANAKIISDNYADMFSVETIQN